MLEAPPDRPLDPAEIDRALAAAPELRWLYVVSHETRAGLKNPLTEIGAVARRRGVAVAADVVSSAFAYPIDVEAAGLDLAVTSSSKAIGAVPGLGIVLVRAAFLERLRAARGAGYYLDLVAECDKQRRESQPRFAQPVALYAALAAACAHLRSIGVEAHMARMQRQMHAIVAHLEALGVARHAARGVPLGRRRELLAFRPGCRIPRSRGACCRRATICSTVRPATTDSSR